jgi:hypothetical protein
MKKNNKVNPLKYFNDAKATASMKAGGAMKDYKKSLIKAQPGIQMGPMTEGEAIRAAFKSPANDPMNYGMGPRLSTPTRNERMDALMKEGARSTVDSIAKVPQYGQQNAAKAARAADGLRHQKKGGSVKRKKK